MAEKIAKILLVDDEEFNTRILALALTSYQVAVAVSGAEALRLATEFQPDLVLLDIGLPDIDGYEVCKQLKQDHELRRTQVIFLTGMTGQRVVADCFKAGAVDYIAKPFGLHEVQSRVQTHIGLKLAHDQLRAKNAFLAATVREQQLNIGLARQILRLVDRAAPRHITLNDQASLFVQTLVWPCHQEGGDHLRVKAEAGRTRFSLKDQSGHSVGCVLRSIATDLLDNALLAQGDKEPLAESVGRLNEALCRSGFFNGDEFCTALMAELDHASLRLEVVAAGHPPVILIRQGRAVFLPEDGENQRNLPLAFMAEADFKAASCQLLLGDRLLILSDGLHQFGRGEAEPPRSQGELLGELNGLLADRPGLDLARLLPAFLARLGGGFSADALQSCNPSGDDLSLIGLEIERLGFDSSLTLVPAEFAGLDPLIEAALAALGPEMEAAGLACSPEEARSAISEAILNAYKHGNRRQRELTINLAWRLGNDFCLAVTDQGPGFDFRRLPDPTNGTMLAAGSGRGLFMLRRAVDWLEWRLAGRRIVMSWRRQEALPPELTRARQWRLSRLPDLWAREWGAERGPHQEG